MWNFEDILSLKSEIVTIKDWIKYKINYVQCSEECVRQQLYGNNGDRWRLEECFCGWSMAVPCDQKMTTMVIEWLLCSEAGWLLF